MAAPQVIVVSPRGSGTPLLAEATTTLGYTPYGTMSGTGPGGERTGPGEVYPLLTAARGQDQALRLLHGPREDLEAAFHDAVNALWRVWWTRLGQPVTRASPVAPALESTLARVPDRDLARLLPGRGCWYVTCLDLQRADAGFLRAWHAGGQPPLVYHHRDVRDRIITQIRLLSRPAGHVGSLPDHLVYRDIISALPTMNARITFALTDPGFPGVEDARRSRWLLHHPAVSVITHEDLAGPAHGGTAEARDRALTRLRNATGHPAPGGGTCPQPPDGGGGEDLAAGVWRRYFTPGHERLLQQHHADLLAPCPR